MERPKAAAIRMYAERRIDDSAWAGCPPYWLFRIGLLVGMGLRQHDPEWAEAAIDELVEEADRTGIAGPSGMAIRSALLTEPRSIITLAAELAGG